MCTLCTHVHTLVSHLGGTLCGSHPLKERFIAGIENVKTVAEPSCSDKVQKFFNFNPNSEPLD